MRSLAWSAEVDDVLFLLALWLCRFELLPFLFLPASLPSPCPLFRLQNEVRRMPFRAADRRERSHGPNVPASSTDVPHEPANKPPLPPEGRVW